MLKFDHAIRLRLYVVEDGLGELDGNGMLWDGLVHVCVYFVARYVCATLLHRYRSFRTRKKARLGSASDLEILQLLSVDAMGFMEFAYGICLSRVTADSLALDLEACTHTHCPCFSKSVCVLCLPAAQVPASCSCI
jgi:hypothetical protein